MTPPLASRRGLLAALGAGTAALLPRGAWAEEASEKAAVIEAGEGACILTPQAIEGPFYRDPWLVRSDIREGRTGVPLRVRLRVIEAGPCTPITGARVDIWHCDAQGLYSGFPGQGDSRALDTSGETFLRGTQDTDTTGWATFETIYPGWYAGRATHIHVKVFLDERTLLIGQIYFPDALNEYLYAHVPAYGGRKVERTVVNANDGIALEEDPERRAFCAVKEERDRYVATLVLGVDRSADGKAMERSRTPAGRPERPPPPPATTGGIPPHPHGPGPARPAIKDRTAVLVPGMKREP